MKTRPKKAKKYSYTKDCKEQPREICDQCEKKSIQPLCDMQERLTCIYKPVEQCKDEAKDYCYKVEKVVAEEVCDMKSIQPLCDMQERLTCIYKPVEQCKDE